MAPLINLYIQPSFQVPGYERCFSGSPFVIKVQRLLQVKRLAFTADPIGWLERAERMSEISATGKLPVLEYDGDRIEDSTTIAYFIEERHARPPLLPKDPVQRARCHFLEEWADEALHWYGVYEQWRVTEAGVVGAAYYADLPDDIRDAVAEGAARSADDLLMRHGIGRYPANKVKADVRRGLDALEVLIGADGYVSGPSLSLADIAIFGQLYRRMAGTNPWLESEVKKRESLSEWVDRVDRETC